MGSGHGAATQAHASLRQGRKDDAPRLLRSACASQGDPGSAPCHLSAAATAAAAQDNPLVSLRLPGPLESLTWLRLSTDPCYDMLYNMTAAEVRHGGGLGQHGRGAGRHGGRAWNGGQGRGKAKGGRLGNGDGHRDRGCLERIRHSPALPHTQPAFLAAPYRVCMCRWVRRSRLMR